MAQATVTGYDPRAYEPLTFHDAAERFRTGDDTPRDFLERCLATIEEREPVVQAFAHLNRDLARAAADASTERWAAGEPLSPIDGMPVGIKEPPGRRRTCRPSTAARRSAGTSPGATTRPSGRCGRRAR